MKRDFPEEHKSCRWGTRGTNDQLFMDHLIFKESKTRQKNVAMSSIEHKKADDIVPKTRKIEYQKMYKKSDNIINFITNTIEN